MKQTKQYGIIVFLLSWVASALLLFLFVRPMDDGMDNAFPGWWVVRMIALGLAVTISVFVLVALFRTRKKIKSFLPTFFKYRPLLELLVRRDFSVRYKRSVLGILWTLLNPLANMVIMSIVFSYLFRHDIPNFPAYVLSGSIVFGCFSEATTSGLHSIVSNAGLLKKVYIPKYIFPLSTVFTAFVNFFFSLLALFVVMLFTKAPFHLTMLLIPLALLYLFLFCAGCGLLLATLQTFFRDMGYLYGVILTAMNYLSAIFYDISIVPVAYMPIFAINPMYHYVDFFRKVALQGVLPRAWDHAVCAGMGFAALFLGAYVFYKKQDQFILHI